MDYRQTAITIFQAAVAAVQPQQLIPVHLQAYEDHLRILGATIPWKAVHKIWVVGAGKAAAAMAQAVELVLGDHLQGGIIITKYAHALPLQSIQCREAAHPVPDANGVAATIATIDLLKQAAADDIVICLLSGGASALWVDLPGGASLEDLQQVFEELLNSGADITEVNTVRKHLSAIKGGQLLRSAPEARWFTLIISDVPGDDLTVIGSGPTVPDTRTFHDARNILLRHHLWDRLPAPIRLHLERGCRGLIPDTPKMNDPVFQRVKNRIIGSSQLATTAAGNCALTAGLHLIDYTTPLTGDVGDAATCLIEIIRQYSGPLPACLIAGGETTVRVTGNGKGGRNQHLALSMAWELEQNPLESNRLVTLLCAGTDGTDGPTDAAGAIVDPTLMMQAHALQLVPQQYRVNQDAYHFFEQTGGLFKTGATQTNVMDLVIIILYAKS